MKNLITDAERLRATMVFVISTLGVRSQAGWNPIAQVMCAAGLAFGSFTVFKQAFIAVFRTLGGGRV